MSDIIEPTDATDEVLVPKEHDDAAPPAAAAGVEDHEAPTSERIMDRVLGIVETQTKEQASQNKRMMMLVGAAMGIVALLLAGVVGVGIRLDFFGFSGSTTGPIAMSAEDYVPVESAPEPPHVDADMDGPPDVEDEPPHPASPITVPSPVVVSSPVMKSIPSPMESRIVDDLRAIERSLESLEYVERSMEDTAHALYGLGTEQEQDQEQFQETW